MPRKASRKTSRKKSSRKKSSRKASSRKSSGQSNKLTKVSNMPPQLREWTTHLNKFRAAHPNLTLTQAMKAAKKTY